MAHPPVYDRAQLDRELQDMLLEDASAILHALSCEACASRDLALSALALGGWTEIEFLERLCARRGGRA